MRTFLSLLLAITMVFALSPQVLAQGEEGEESGGATEEGGSEEGGGETADPWEAPKAADAADEEEPVGEPEVIAPSGYPVSEIDRPLTLPKMTLEPRLEMPIDILKGDVPNWFGIRLAAGMGVIDDLEVGLEFPLSFTNKFRAGDFRVYGMYEFGPFVDGKLFAAGRLQMIIPLADEFLFWGLADFGMLFEGLAKFKIHDMFAVVGNLGMGFLVTADPTFFAIDFDLGALVQPIEPLALWLTFGVFALAGDNAPDAAIPMTFRGQYTLIGDLDFFLEFAFMDLGNGADWFRIMAGAAYRLGF